MSCLYQRKLTASHPVKLLRFLYSTFLNKGQIFFLNVTKAVILPLCLPIIFGFSGTAFVFLHWKIIQKFQLTCFCKAQHFGAFEVLLLQTLKTPRINQRRKVMIHPNKKPLETLSPGMMWSSNQKWYGPHTAECNAFNHHYLLALLQSLRRIQTTSAILV